MIKESIIERIIELENLHWAWEKVKYFYNEDNFWCDELEIVTFQANYEEELKDIRNKIKNGTYKLNQLKPIFFPKKESVNRQMFWVSLKDQLVWLAVMNIIGKYYDKQMPFWSYGNRLYISIFPNKEESTNEKIIWGYGPYRNTTKKVYRSFGQSWPRFRKDIYISSKVITQKESQLTDEEKEDVIQNELLSKSHKIKYKDKSFWKNEVESKDIYWCSLDLKKFYPNAKNTVILKNFEKYGDFLNSKFNDFDILLELLKNILDFKIDFNNGMNIKDSEFEKIDLDKNKVSFDGIPTGLFSAGFLSNIAMIDIDIKLNNIIEKKSKDKDRIALFRFVDDYTIISPSFESCIELLQNIEQNIYNEFDDNLKINWDKTKPEELKDFYLKLKKQEFSNEEIDKVEKSMKLNPDFPTQLMNHTLKKMSMSNRLSFELLDSEEEKKYIQDIEHLLMTDISEEEIREDTRLSFASSKLSILVPKKKYDYSEIYKIKCEIKDIKQEKNISIEEKNELLKSLEQKLIQSKNKLDIEIQKDRKKTSKLLEYAIFNYPDKLKLWKNLINFYKSIGFGTEHEIELLSIFKILKNAKNLKQINEYTHEYLITYIYNVLSNAIISIIKQLQFSNISKRERDIKESFLKGVFNKKVLITLSSYKYSSFYFIQSKELFNVSLKICEYHFFRKGEKEFFSSFTMDKQVKYYCWIIDKFDLELSRPFIEKFLKSSSIHNNYEYYIASLYPEIKYEGINRILSLDSNNYFSFSWWFKYLSIHKSFDFSIIKNIDAKNALEFFTCNEEISIFDFISKKDNNYSEEISLKIIEKIIQEYKTISEDIFSIQSNDKKVMQQFPYNIFIKNIDEEVSININNIENKEIKDKRYFPDFIDFNCKSKMYEEKQFIYGLGILLYQLISKDLDLPIKFYQPSMQLINSNYFIGQLNNYHISSFSYEIIKACLSKRNRELEKLNLENFEINDFEDEEKNSIKIGNIDNLLIYVSSAIRFLNDKKYINGNKTRYLIPKKLFSMTSNFGNNETIKNNENLKIGYIQVNFDNDTAWGPSDDISLSIKSDVENYIWQEILKGFHKMNNHHTKPDIIIIPELTIPTAYINKLKELSKEINAVVFAGLDWQVNHLNEEIKNKAIMIVPNNWNTNLNSTNCNITFLGKKNPANLEKGAISKYNKDNGTNYKFISDDNMYLIDAQEFGKIGFAICADFYDIERFVAYKGRVQHIIILALNKDTNSFFAISEAIARLVMCNVVICNTGLFGDSLAFSPYKDSFKRMIYRNQGANLFSTQVIELPVKSLIEDQKQGSSIENSNKIKNFKMPPEYEFLE
jgi:hypothetical protein